jgi:hypothetical protein
MIRGVLLAKWLLMIASSLGYGREAGQLKCEDTTKLGRDDPIRQRLANTIHYPARAPEAWLSLRGAQPQKRP